MAQTGTIWAGLLGLQSARFDKCEVWDAEVNGYIDVALALEDLRQQIGSIPIAAEEERISALEAKVLALEDKSQTLSENKADKFVALDPLSLDEGVFPNELSQGGGPTPASASAIQFNGVDAYFSFPNGRGDLLDFTKDWSIGFSVKVQGASVQGANLATFGSGGVSLMLKVQGAPSISSNWG